MKNYMNRWVLLALKAIVILVWLACLWGQLFASNCIAVAFVVAVILNAVLPSEEHFLSAPKEAPAADAE